MMMRILFVSEASDGGSPRSQRELARHLVARGHVLQFLVTEKRPPRATVWFYDQLSDLSVRLQGRAGAELIARVRDSCGQHTHTTEVEGLPHRIAPLVQNALPAVIRTFRPDVVVANSVERWAWRRIHAVCRAARIPTVLYVREDDSLRHLESGAVPDLLAANAESLAESLRRQGHACEFVPSVVDLSITRTESARRVALAVNPVTSRGGDIVWKVADRMPDVPFVVQESWPLDEQELADVEAHAAQLPNVEFRRAVPPGPGLYGDTRVLLVPYRVGNRPRVILEAQSNGIPVIVGELPALIEAMGDGGVSVPLESIDDWVTAIRRMWDDEDHYRALAEAALTHSRRPDVDPDLVTDRFQGLLLAAIQTPE